jgi:hypothetical protein
MDWHEQTCESRRLISHTSNVMRKIALIVSTSIAYGCTADNQGTQSPIEPRAEAALVAEIRQRTAITISEQQRKFAASVATSLSSAERRHALYEVVSASRLGRSHAFPLRDDRFAQSQLRRSLIDSLRSVFDSAERSSGYDLDAGLFPSGEVASR